MFIVKSIKYLFGYENNNINVVQKLKHKYGHIKENDDFGDIINFNEHKNLFNIKSVDLRNLCPPIYNQENLGSCTANAIAGGYEFDENRQKEKIIFTPSRLFIYYNERNMEGTTQEDSGAKISDGIKCINTIGVCPEEMYPYDTSKYMDKPPNYCYEDGKRHHSVKYKRLNHNLQQFKQSLLIGLPIIFGMVVYESFESPETDKTGVVQMPSNNEKVMLHIFKGDTVRLRENIKRLKIFLYKPQFDDSFKGIFGISAFNENDVK